MTGKTSVEELNKWLKQPEGHHLELKAAKNGFDSKRDLPDYCAALANEGGGRLILGIDPSGVVAGTKAFQGTHNKIAHELYTKIKIRIDVEEMHHPNGRVLIFHVPGRSQGQLIKSTGKYKYPMRMGESLIEMDNATLKKVLTETEPDFSCGIVTGLSLNDIDDGALDVFKKLWAKKSDRKDYQNYTNDKILKSAGLMFDKGLTYASLILFGKKEK